MWRSPALSSLALALLLAAAPPARAQPACTPRSFCSADVDGNGAVDLADFGLLALQFGGHPDRELNADLDGDGWVGIGDVSVLARQFGLECPGDCPANTPLDFDQDGLFDFVACGDWNGDGRLTMDLGCQNADPTTTCDADGDKSDLLACLESLDDAGGRILEVLPGRYEVPDEPFTSHHGPASGPDAGLLNLPSNTRLHCHPGAILMGTDERHREAPDQVSVLHVPRDSSGVVIEGCEMDQGWPDGHACPAGACQPLTRMGVLLYGSDSIVRDNTIHHTRHSCIYTKRGDRNLIENNHLDWCGGAWSVTGGLANYPGIYVYSDLGIPVRDVAIVNTTCDRTAAPCINTRLNGTNDQNRISNLSVAGTRHVPTTNNADGSVPECVRLRGVDDAQLVDTWCEGTTGLHLVAGETRFRDDPGCNVAAGTWADCVNASLGITVRGATVLDSVGTSPVELGGWSKDVRLEDVVIDGATWRWPCIQGQGPFEGLVIDGLDASGCGSGGIELGRTTLAWSWDASQSVVVQDVRIDDPDAFVTDNRRGSGIALHQGCVGCTFDRIAIHGWTDYGLAVGAGHDFVDNHVAWLDLEQLGSWYRGERLSPYLPTCDASRLGEVFTLLDAVGQGTCVGGGSVSNLCVCDGSVWRDTDQTGGTRARSTGIALEDAATVEGNLFQHLVCTNARYGNHCVALPGHASGNAVRDLLAEDKRRLLAWNPNAPDANNGALDLNGATDTSVEQVSCVDLRDLPGVAERQCVCWDAACTPQ